MRLMWKSKFNGHHPVAMRLVKPRGNGNFIVSDAALVGKKYDAIALYEAELTMLPAALAAEAVRAGRFIVWEHVG